MFRSPEYCDRYECIPIQLDTPITTPGAGVGQRKNGYQFTINEVDLVVVPYCYLFLLSVFILWFSY